VRVLSLFSGVGGFDLGFERSGMSTVAQVEWDAKCQQVLARHWPDVPRWGDVSDVNGADLPDCDLVAFGSPCQDLSVAGKRAGMVEGETRSGLFYEAIRIIEELQHVGRGPAWVVWENVAGALSSNGGRDFGAVIDSLADIGAVDIQWRVLDAQWFGVAQRRRRVFVVARLDSGAEGGPQVLPVGASVRRDSATLSEMGSHVSTGTANNFGACGTDDNNGHLVSLMAFSWQENQLVGQVWADQVPGLMTSKTYAVAQPEGDLLAVRKLTATECERLMGWPDGWTAEGVDADGNPVTIADSSRYRMCGNGVASPVAEWIGRCIMEAESTTREGQ
jgi:DNA (cytosine-5)-methyltransferase 1